MTTYRTRELGIMTLERGFRICHDPSSSVMIPSSGVLTVQLNLTNGHQHMAAPMHYSQRHRMLPEYLHIWQFPAQSAGRSVSVDVIAC